MADIGWITGHSYVVYGPLCNGGTTVMFESIPTYPNPGIGVRPHMYTHVVLPTCMYVLIRSSIEGMIILWELTYCARHTVHLEYLSLLIMVHTSKSSFPSLPPSLLLFPPLSLFHFLLSSLPLLSSLSLPLLSRSLLGDGAETEDHPLLHGAHCPPSATEGWG